MSDVTGSTPQVRGVELHRRFGGHGGISTEWELQATYPHLIDVVRALPTLPLVQIGHGRYSSHVYLPEGVPYDLAGKVAATWTSASVYNVVLMARLTRLLVRCELWGQAFVRHRPTRQKWCDYRFARELALEHGTELPSPPER